MLPINFTFSPTLLGLVMQLSGHRSCLLSLGNARESIDI